MTTERRAGSRAWFERAQAVIAGGVSSPARSFKAVGGDPPVVMARARGAYLEDVDGNRYIDYLAAFAPLVLGHGHPRVLEAVHRQLDAGTLYGTPAPAEIELAEELVRVIPGLDQLRFVTTGTEAVMSALRLARAATGRRRLIKFAGTYHGHSDAMLVEAGSGAATAGPAIGGGIPPAVQADVITLPFNDPEALRAVMAREGREVAAIITEPVVGNMGIVPPQPGYLETMRSLADQYGALLIFDEVITAFRFRYGVVAESLGVVPDLYCLGKTIGGGLAAGAYGGRRDLMRLLSPQGPVFQAGTLAGNPLSSAAGLATLAVLRDENPYPRMEALAAELETGLRALAERVRVPLTINRVGSAFTVYFGRTAPVTNFREAAAADADRFARFHRAMLDEGVYLAPSRFEAWFVSAQHQPEDIRRTLAAAERALAALP
ncbi:Glutamate-1-semialdehyde 2,1-aminomutase 1 [Candidatus Hydrogenisulfobacillus filiaventi]|uniref:Glutamate-1-semialdehyde 2,1-aminomutase n=1 Tax=Candidatus Hydrogenisulfobacillus filiaventi TaxID=2707344 RepID=A0A6F8ZJQ5_9FIRM|nr:glutamate-1-semialdehyde 2,1-aminomutase [Bacillota bacterium]CAB1130111.1 Glutamate-1-semialdehyde 2,1-aminomutase 1 [Candidatus Hydrogenisulfobacillus filiaventi]